MLYRYSEVFRTLLAAADVVLISGAWLLAYWLRFETGLPVPRGVPEPEPYLYALAVIAPLFVVAFRSNADTREHVALIIGEQSGDREPLVRVHSECLTGDILGSLKCDCGPQLDAAILAMAKHAEEDGGWGAVLYLRQEGRGIGLINKLRAYQLQDQGFDTVDANQRLGLPDEARDFPVAARMLDLMGTRTVRLLTNNPKKVEALTAAGIEVSERVPHQLPDNPHNARYLATKRDRSGHLLT